MTIVEIDLIPAGNFSRMKIVLSLGGSVLMRDFDAEKIGRFAEVIEEIAEGNKVFVVVGGGKIAREYIKIAKRLGADNTLCDYIGIEVTRINAMLLCSALSNAPKVIPKDFRDAYELSLNHNVVVMGGTFPGHTTDATSALLAEFVKADLFLNATSVDGIYSDDPKKNPNARRFDKIKADELLKIVLKLSAEAGGNFPLDVLSVKIIQRSGIRTIVFLGEPENIKRVVEGDYAEIGTLVEP